MKNQRNVVQIAGILVASIMAVTSCGRGEFNPETMTPPIITVNVDSVSAFDVADPAARAGWADAIFVGTVTEYLSTVNSGDLPETQFQVTVSESLKGDLPSTVVVNQLGGQETNGNLVVVDDSPLIEEGKTYLFSARIYAEKGWFTIATELGAVEVPDDTSARRGTGASGSEGLVEQMRESIANAKPFGDEASRPTIPDAAGLPTDTDGAPPLTAIPESTIPDAPSTIVQPAFPTPTN